MGINLTSYAIIGAIVFALLGLLGALITIRVIRTLSDKHTSCEDEEKEPQKIKAAAQPVSKPQPEKVQQVVPEKKVTMKEVIFTKVEDRTKVQLFILSEKQSLTIGRSQDKNNWMIADDQTISSKHCKIYMVEDEVYVDDLNSTNGTYVNGKRIIQPTRLHNEYKVQLGASEYSVKIKNY